MQIIASNGEVVEFSMSDIGACIEYNVVAYDNSGYDDRSRVFDNAADALSYAKNLSNNYMPVVMRKATIYIKSASMHAEVISSRGEQLKAAKLISTLEDVY